MTILGTVRRPNGTAISTTNAMGQTELQLVAHVPGSGQYKLEFVPPFAAVPAVTVNHVWSTTDDDVERSLAAIIRIAREQAR